METPAVVAAYPSYTRRLNRPYGRIVLIWAAVGSAVAFMFAFFGDAGGDIDRYMYEIGCTGTIIASE